MEGTFRTRTLGSMDVPDEEIAAAQLNCSRSSVGRPIVPLAEEEEEGEKSTAAEMHATGDAHAGKEAGAALDAATAEPVGAGAFGEPVAAPKISQTEAPVPSDYGAATDGNNEKKIPPGAVKMLAASTVEEFQKKVKERRVRMSQP